MINPFFHIERMDVVIRPKSRAHATLFWFLYGIRPSRIVMSCSGAVEWHFPAPLRQDVGAGGTFSRDGVVR
jgi:hypothetical protein